MITHPPQPFQAGQLIVSVHIPKCAGTSFRFLLKEVYGERLWLNYGDIFTAEQADISRIPQGVECIHGHFFANAFDEVLPNRTLVTWVRHPVDRVVSNYYHFLRGPDFRDECCRLLHEKNLSLLEFAELDWMRNEATRYLSGKSHDDFAFVGISERFVDSMNVFSSLFLGGRSFRPIRENTNPGRARERYQLSKREYDYILALNSVDYVWYEQAARRMEVIAGPERPDSLFQRVWNRFNCCLN